MDSVTAFKRGDKTEILFTQWTSNWLVSIRLVVHCVGLWAFYSYWYASQSVRCYCLTEISTWAERSISCIFSFLVPFLYTARTKPRIDRELWILSLLSKEETKLNNKLPIGLHVYTGESKHAPLVIPSLWSGITSALGFVFASMNTQAS